MTTPARLTKLLLISAILAAPVTPVFARSYSSHSTSHSSNSRSSRSSTAGGAGFAVPKSGGTSYRSSAPKVTATKPVQNGYSTTGYKVGSGAIPSFGRGYRPPIGSVVYNRGFSFTDLIFWSYIFSHTGHQEVVVQQPDGTKVQTTDPSQTDWIYYLDWAIMILLAVGLIILIVWFVNKHTKPKGGPHYASI